MTPLHPAPEPLYADPRLAACYDTLDGERDDLDHYEEILDELGARSVIDVGCGTGSLSLRLAARGVAVTGIDPASASLEVARAKPGAERVTWLHGTAEDLSAPGAGGGPGADAAVMTGNVAQVFLTDAAWASTLRAIRAALREGGHLVFEARRPAARAWEEWSAAIEDEIYEVPGTGRVRKHPLGVEVDWPIVTLTEEFHLDGGAVVDSRVTLRFREEQELRDALSSAGFETREIRQAPDRPGREFVVIARAV
ncbi:bifunctional 2-polyprenyl-6-hydroxyphenol methylase/3-demethylubiquinol 3-O-methyltransferase UbiG [Brachybacterium sp. YJGR34]|uniref:class I SAM-dependent methyltransferase n=1 Tax=Brachybacterium sp. YJGR34 TaxID=2059911 RepID=UPI000E0B5C2E|nr:class I SAM-dependent methyltransferase [Brachybacterium sp. YJGR34]